MVWHILRTWGSLVVCRKSRLLTPRKMYPMRGGTGMATKTAVSVPKGWAMGCGHISHLMCVCVCVVCKWPRHPAARGRAASPHGKTGSVQNTLLRAIIRSAVGLRIVLARFFCSLSSENPFPTTSDSSAVDFGGLGLGGLSSQLQKRRHRLRGYCSTYAVPTGYLTEGMYNT